MHIQRLEQRCLFTAYLSGDFTLDGKVDGDDYAAIDAGFSGQSNGFTHGDADSNGRIDADDYWQIDKNYGDNVLDTVGVHGTLASMSGLTVTTYGAVYANKSFTSAVTVSANSVYFLNCKFTVGDVAYAVKQNSGFTGLVLENCEVTGPQADTGIVFYDGEIRRCYIHDLGGDGLKPRGPCLIEDCWIQHLGMEDGSHADGIQIRTSDGSAIADVHVAGCWFDMPTAVSQGQLVRPEYQAYGSNSCIFVECPTPGLLVENSLLEGGNYCVGIGSGENAVYRNNVIGRRLNWGPKWSSTSSKWNAQSWINNRWADTGAIVP